ncbi:SpoIIE family protein phosphatase [Streptomyces sp. FXJ1.172]|uniref:PP2C family protein-serine/threonine phosphatase n=1 Tax=Streptomyces sp. FXJ1.172 TaxID=710705 RepID=UPI000B333FA5|nr:SpoIIE family protein phosphatase [Streptomyces sp. FXJ1.172]WEO94584.1 SpoIIE family protein phosphatase [Streptomyces sp. FXJ1.172]
MARWIRSRRRSLPAGGGHRRTGSGDEEALTSTKTQGAAAAAKAEALTAGARFAALREALARIGTTLEESTTCAELTGAAVGLAGGTAAVLRRTEQTISGYEQITGDADLLPDARWATAVARAGGAPALGEPPERWLEYAGAPRTRAALCAPLKSGDDTYGVLVWARSGEPLHPGEAELLSLLAERAASHIRHARAYESVNRTAGDLQRALLSEPGRPHPNLDIAIRYLPSGGGVLVGGDWCETVRLHFGRTLLVVGDVMGHGLEAAVDMNAYRSSLRYIASADLPPHRVLRQMDEISSREADRRPATCLLAGVDPGRGQVTLASAGHLPPVLIADDGEATLLSVPVGPPLGTGLGGYESATHKLAPGQTLVLFTDGLVERRGEDIDASLARLSAVRFPAGDGLDEVLDTILERLDARHAEDDVAALAARPYSRHAGSP